MQLASMTYHAAAESLSTYVSVKQQILGVLEKETARICKCRRCVIQSALSDPPGLLIVELALEA